jgi:hypothetical protein
MVIIRNIPRTLYQTPERILERGDGFTAEDKRDLCDYPVQSFSALALSVLSHMNNEVG